MQWVDPRCNSVILPLFFSFSTLFCSTVNRSDVRLRSAEIGVSVSLCCAKRDVGELHPTAADEAQNGPPPNRNLSTTARDCTAALPLLPMKQQPQPTPCGALSIQWFGLATSLKLLGLTQSRSSTLLVPSLVPFVAASLFLNPSSPFPSNPFLLALHCFPGSSSSPPLLFGLHPLPSV